MNYSGFLLEKKEKYHILQSFELATAIAIWPACQLLGFIVISWHLAYTLFLHLCITVTHLVTFLFTAVVELNANFKVGTPVRLSWQQSSNLVL
jgi:hypothetical protein